MRARRWLKAHRYTVVAACIILAASAIRIGLIAQSWPGTDSDDSTMGLMAKHILTLGEHPIFFYGQSYMGALEAYVGALMFAVFGVSSFALKCGLVLLYAAFLVVMYLLLSQAFSRVWALAGLMILSLGDDDMLYHQLEAYGGYLETLLFGALIIVLAAWIMRSPPQAARNRWRPWLYLGWGLAAGIGIWSDPLIAPFVAISALLLILTRWAELRRRLGALALIGLLIGISPWIIYVATSASLGSATSFLQRGTLSQSQHATPAPRSSVTTPASPAPPAPTLGQVTLDHIRGTVFIAVANNTGATALCPLTLTEAWPPDHWSSPPIRQCIAIRAVWGSGFLVLLALALGLELRTFLAVWRATRLEESATSRVVVARSAARLTAMGAPAATTVFFALSSASSFAPYQYSRYLISIAIAMPVMLATLWDHAPRLPSVFLLSRPSLRLRHTPSLAVLAAALLLCAVLASGTLSTYGEIPTYQSYSQQQMALVHWLVAHDDTRILSDYWTCIRTVFQSDEQVVCSVIDGQFRVMPNRYPPYDAIVAASSHPAYVFQLSSAQVTTFPDFASQMRWTYSRSVVDGQFAVFRVLST